MRQAPTSTQKYFIVLAAMSLFICYGCAPTSKSNTSAEAIFTQAVETASARQTSSAQDLLSTVTAATRNAPTADPASTTDSSAATQIAQNTPEAAPPTQTSLAPAITPTSGPTTTPTSAPQNTQAAPGNEAACIPGNTPQTGKVLDIVDGDTIKVIIDGKTYTVRYIGIDAPEYVSSKAPYSTEARLKNSELVFAKEITLYTDSTEADTAGRLLRYVKVGDTFVNWALVAQGFAKAAPDGSDTACDAIFKNAQDQAAANKTGLWANP